MYSTNVVSRKDADIFLRNSLKYAGMSSLLYKTCYNSVRLFGSSHYTQDSEVN